MKNLIFSIIFIVFSTPIFAQTGTIIVNVSGIENNKGIIRIGLYNNKNTFPTYGKHFKGIEPSANTSGVNCVFKNIPSGTYAVAVWHDENENKKMDKNIFGIPKENYGFSKNIYRTFGPPDFEDVSFKIVNDKITKLTINLE